MSELFHPVGGWNFKTNWIHSHSDEPRFITKTVFLEAGGPRRNAQQNFPWQAARHALLNFYEAHPESGPEGYLETVAALAAAKLVQVIAEVESRRACPGLILQLDLITRQVETYKAIGIHDCPRCGPHRPPQTRSVDLMSREQEWLWKQQQPGNPNA